MTRRKSLFLAGLTIWPLIFPLLGWLIERTGLLPLSSTEPPPAFLAFMLMLALTAVLIPGLVIFYLFYLFTRLKIDLDHKLVWAVLLVIGHVFVMPIFWYLFIWKPRVYPPMAASSRFSLLVFAPLLLTLLIPLIFIIPMSLVSTFSLSSNFGTDLASSIAQIWAWVFGPILGGVIIFLAGRWLYTRYFSFNPTHAAWIGLWAIFTLFSLPIAWYATFVIRGLIPSDGPPNSLPGLTGVAFVLAVLAQPFILGWLYIIFRLLKKGYPAGYEPIQA